MKHMTAEELIAYGETLPMGRTRDKSGLVLTSRDDGRWSESTFDDNGNELSFKNSDGFWSESTYDDNGNVLAYKDSNGAWCERTYDDNGLEITYKDSEGVWRGFSNEEIKAERDRLKQVRKNLKASMKKDKQS